MPHVHKYVFNERLASPHHTNFRTRPTLPFAPRTSEAMINLFQQRRKAPLASVAESQEISPPTSPSKSAKSTKSAQSRPTASGSGTDSVNPASSHAESEQVTRAKHYLTSMGALRVIRDVEDHLREKRFFLNQLWQLFSALNRFVCCSLPISVVQY